MCKTSTDPNHKKKNLYPKANERLKYWFQPKQYNDLYHLQWAIQKETPIGSQYRQFFMCAFSNILKGSSKWLTKSIKPQLDPHKTPADVYVAFVKQVRFMMLANSQLQNIKDSTVDITTANFLDTNYSPRKADMIVTSPPYVTSYEYADLHQLSTLWLGFVNDYRELREGAVGSLYHHTRQLRHKEALLSTGTDIVSNLEQLDRSKARSVSEYFLDMQKVARKSYSVLNRKGMAFFVIGNTEYKGVKVDNAKHLVQSLLYAGFKSVDVAKRKISKKILTPYRDKFGRFTTDSSGRKVYAEEFIVAGIR